MSCNDFDEDCEKYNKIENNNQTIIKIIDKSNVKEKSYINEKKNNESSNKLSLL